MASSEQLTAVLRRALTGRTNRFYDRLCPYALARLGDASGRSEALAVGDAVPPGWMRHVPFGPFFRDAYAPAGSATQEDGIVDRTAPESSVYPDFAAAGLDLPRSMFGGSTITFGPQLPRAGMRVRMTERLLDVKVRHGRDGLPLGVIQIGVTIDDADAVEEHGEDDEGGPDACAAADGSGGPRGRLQSEVLDFIRLAPRAPSDAAPLPPAAAPAALAVPAAPLEPAAGSEAWQPSSWVPSELTLFKYSAATFNAHRIHYDLRWATTREAYPALVVHGPLLQQAMLDFARDAMDASASSIRGRRIGSFTMRALAPSWCGETVVLTGAASPEGSGRGGGFSVRAHNSDGATVCEGTGTFGADDGECLGS